MKIVVVRGTGRLGSQVVAELHRRGHEAPIPIPTPVRVPKPARECF